MELPRLYRLNRSIDRAIGEGTLIACVKDAKHGQASVEIRVVGSLQPEVDLAKNLLCGWLRYKYPHLNPLAVRLVSLRGSWQEAPQWTGNWYELENTQST